MSNCWKISPYCAIVLVAFNFLCQHAKAQEPQFSQFFANQMYLNPAFTGNTQLGRFSTIHRRQWNQIPGAYTSRAFAYDHALNKSNSGIGVMVVTDKAGLADLSFKELAIAYSYNAVISRRRAVRMGMRIGNVWRSADFSQLTFSDQLETGSSTTVENLNFGTLIYLDFSGGAVYYSDRMWFGISVDHINRPNQAFILNKDARLPIRYTAHGGYVLPLEVDAKKEIKRSIRFAALYKGQQDWDQVDVGIYYTVYPMVFGMWYRGIPGIKAYQQGYPNNDAINLLTGIEISRTLWLGYSYDYTISWLYGRTGGSHEVSLVYEYLTKKAARYKKRNMPCARF